MNLNKDLLELQKLVYNKCLFQIKNLRVEAESKEYKACVFDLNFLKIIFRTAKITPKKVGQFVTFWKRNENGPIEPFSEQDEFDYFVICVRDGNQFGQFVIPKSKLIEEGIISTSKKEGKRGFRVYPPWDEVNNKQADKTQKWQLKYFMTINEFIDFNKVKSLHLA